MNQQHPRWCPFVDVGSCLTPTSNERDGLNIGWRAAMGLAPVPVGAPRVRRNSTTICCGVVLIAVAVGPWLVHVDLVLRTWNCCVWKFEAAPMLGTSLCFKATFCVAVTATMNARGGLVLQGVGDKRQIDS